MRPGNRNYGENLMTTPAHSIPLMTVRINNIPWLFWHVSASHQCKEFLVPFECFGVILGHPWSMLYIVLIYYSMTVTMLWIWVFSKAVETETAASELWQGIEKVEGRRDSWNARNFDFVTALRLYGNHRFMFLQLDYLILWYYVIFMLWCSLWSCAEGKKYT